MRKIYLIFLLSLFSILDVTAQGSDVIICLDNSGSITANEYNDMSNSVKSLITNILSCNPANRVSVIHYGTSGIGGTTNDPKIFIESNFTNNATLANSFIRRLNSGDFFHETVGFIANALDNVANVNIVSPQTSLTRSSSNSLVFFLFTDAFRSAGSSNFGSYLVNYNSNLLNSNAAFQNFTTFKNARNAKFVVVHVSTDDPVNSPPAAAIIASRGGLYNGIIENYPLEPDGNNLPRFYLNKTNFVLTPQEITNVSQDICQISLVGSIRLNPVNENCPLYPLNITGDYTIPNGATISNITLNIINSSGTIISTLSNPIVTGNTFSFIANEANFGVSPLSGNFEFQVNATVTQGTLSIQTTSLSSNAGPDVSFNDCSICCASCCVDNQTLSFPVLANFIDTRQANLRILATNTLDNGSFASYHAGDNVLLKAGFVARSGSRARIYIEGCSGTYSLRQPENNINFNPNESYLEYDTIVEKNKSLKIYPNPTSDIIKIELLENKFNKIIISDLLENLVYENEFENINEFEINISNIPKGIYVLKIHTTNNKIYFEKIVRN